MLPIVAKGSKRRRSPGEGCRGARRRPEMLLLGTVGSIPDARSPDGLTSRGALQPRERASQDASQSQNGKQKVTRARAQKLSPGRVTQNASRRRFGKHFETLVCSVAPTASEPAALWSSEALRDDSRASNSARPPEVGSRRRALWVVVTGGRSCAVGPEAAAPDSRTCNGPVAGGGPRTAPGRRRSAPGAGPIGSSCLMAAPAWPTQRLGLPTPGHGTARSPEVDSRAGPSEWSDPTVPAQRARG